MSVQQLGVRGQHLFRSTHLDTNSQIQTRASTTSHSTSGATSGELSARLQLLDTLSQQQHSGYSPNEVVTAFQEQFAAIAEDAESFHALMQQSFGLGYDKNTAEGIRQQILSGDFSWMPQVQVISADGLADSSGTQGPGIALAAFDGSGNTIYLSREVLSANPDTALALLTEEVGHALDMRLNTSDTAGDEGALFARLMAGEDVSAADMAELRAENDHGTIMIDGEAVSVEYGFFSSIGNAISSVASSVGNAIGSAARSVGNAIGSVANTVSDGIERIGNRVSDVVHSASDLVTDGLDLINENIVSPVLNRIPGGAWFTDRVVQPAFGLLDTGVHVAANLVDTVVDTTHHLVSGGVRVAGNLFSGNFSGAWDALRDTGRTFLSDTLGGIVESGAIALHGLAEAIDDAGNLGETRGLTSSEIEYLRDIYGDTVDYDEISVQRGGIKTVELFGLSLRSHAVGNDIFLEDRYFDSNGALTPRGLQILSHEVGHVWQFQNDGANYISEAIYSYVDDQDAAYDYLTPLSQQTLWDELTPDQQAELATIIGIAKSTDPSGDLTAQGVVSAVLNYSGVAIPVPDAATMHYLNNVQQLLMNGDV